MKILYIIHSCPYPPNKGDRIRSFNIIKYISKNHDLKVIYTSFDKTDHWKKEKLLKYCSYVECVSLNRFSAYLKCFKGLIKNKPLTMSFFKSRKVTKLIDCIDYDIILVDCSSMAQYVMDKERPKIIDFVDIDSEKWLSYGERHRFLKSYIYTRESKKLKSLESKIVDKFDACISVSDQERDLLENKNKVFVVRNGIDYEYFNKDVTSRSNNKKYIIFTGAMDYFPNIDGVEFFCKEIFPIIKNEVNGIKFVIAGMNPAKRIKKLESDEITVTGAVRDIRNYISGARVCVVPLRIARGVQNKILEAMSMGIPVVTTRVANNGIKAENNKEIFIADDPKEFARKTIELINDKNLRRRITRQARIFVEDNFDWSRNLQGLDRIIFSLVEQKHIKP